MLLGFFKYFWRDAIARVGKQADVLKARLRSVNVSGLGISPIPAETFVTYAGSLNGGDFRVVGQVGPLVLHSGLVPDLCLEAWKAAANLVPLIWQPVIYNLARHLVGLIHFILKL